ncbi:MAG: hypothetical protein JF616_16680 [Fibrobacteres bacterium]|nr:hypothetical protein [Fibrobacterota bacterium]
MDSVSWTLNWGPDSLRFGLNYICLAALDSNGASATAIYPIYRIKELPPPPGIPSLTAPTDNAKDIQRYSLLSWTKVDGAASYELRIAAAPDFTKDLTIRSGLTAPFDTLNFSNYSTFYYWKVRALNQGGFGEWSQVRHYTTVIAPPGYPVKIQPADRTIDVPAPTHVVWYALPTATGYEVELDTSSDFKSALRVDTLVSDSLCNLPGLKGGQKYYWHVRGQNPTGWGVWSASWEFTVVPAEPEIPQLTEPAAGAADQPVWAKLKWRKSARAVSYRVQVATDAAFANLAMDDSAVADSAKESDLQRSTVYLWRVRAKNGGGISGWSQVRSFTTTSEEAPLAPELLTPLDGAVAWPYPAAFSWSPVATAVTYHVQASTDSGFAKVADQDSLTSLTSAHLFGLAYTTQHYWRARAKGKGGAGAWSGIRKFTTGIAPPPYPQLLSPANGAADQASPLALKWAKGRNSATYDVEVAVDSLFDVLLRSDSLLFDTTLTMDTFKAQTPYFWRARGANAGGTGTWSPYWKFTIGASVSIPETYSVNRSGPFRSGGELRYALPKAGFVSINYYDLHGKQVASFVNRIQGPGYYALSVGEALRRQGALIQIFRAGDFLSRDKVVLFR